MLKENEQELEQDMQNEAPAEPWANLAYMLNKYCITANDSVEETKRFLSQGDKVELPQTIKFADRPTIPYRIYPTCAYQVINSCVKLLEVNLNNELSGKRESAETKKQLIGAMCLADQLFHFACSSPDSKFTIYKTRDEASPAGKDVLNPHGRRIKQLADRLHRYHISQQIGLKDSGIELPELTCKLVLEDELKQGKLLEMADSLDRMRDSTGYEATEGAIGSEETFYDPNFEDLAEASSEMVDQATWTGISGGGFGSTLNVRDVQRANVLSRSPKAWIWNYNESPMEFVVNYLASNSYPALEEAHTLLARGIEDVKIREAATLAICVQTHTKRNPDNFWKIIKKISTNFDGNRGIDMEKTIQKLDCARFTICLDTNNLRSGINPESFQKVFKEKVHQILGDEKRRDLVTRNELLLETLAQVTALPENGGKAWDKIQQDQWLENLQTMAVGSYENSIGMENQRKQLLNRLNHLFRVPREELERTRHSPQENAEVAAKLDNMLGAAADAFHGYLSGKTGQMARRELRTKILSMREDAEKRGRHDLAQKLTDFSKFVTSISSQVKSGEWYSRKDANKDQLFEFLALMLHTPKTGELEFPGSKEPEARDSVEITCDFLQALQNKETEMGKRTIEENLEMARDFEMEHEGGRLTVALGQISKSAGRERKSDKGKPKKSTSAKNETRRDMLEKAIELCEVIYGSPSPTETLKQIIDSQVEILRKPQTLNPEEQGLFKENLKFWQAMHHLTHNQPNVDEHFEINSFGRATIQNIVAIANAKLENREIVDKNGVRMQQFNLSKTRERAMLSCVTIPLGLWLANDEKGGQKKRSHAEFIQELQTSKNACDIALDITSSDTEIDEKLTDFKIVREKVKFRINTELVGEIINSLNNPADIAAGLDWEIRNPEKAAEIFTKNPEIDSPIALIQYVRRNPAGGIEPKRDKELADCPDM